MSFRYAPSWAWALVIPFCLAGALLGLLVDSHRAGDPISQFEPGGDNAGVIFSVVMASLSVMIAFGAAALLLSVKVWKPVYLKLLADELRIPNALGRPSMVVRYADIRRVRDMGRAGEGGLILTTDRTYLIPAALLPNRAAFKAVKQTLREKAVAAEWSLTPAGGLW